MALSLSLTKHRNAHRQKRKRKQKARSSYERCGNQIPEKLHKGRAQFKADWKKPNGRGFFYQQQRQARQW